MRKEVIIPAVTFSCFSSKVSEFFPNLSPQIISSLEETQYMSIRFILGLTELHLHVLTTWKEGEKYSEVG